MVDWVGLLLRAVYFYSRLIGLSNFEYDWKSGRVFTCWGTTFYAVAINLTIFGIHIYCSTGQINLEVLFGNENKLHIYVIVFMSSLRTIAGFSTLLNRWRCRNQMMDLVRNILHLFLVNPQVDRWSRCKFLIKIFSILATDLFHVALAVDVMGGMNSAQTLGLVLQFWTSTIVNLAVSQHYLVMLFARAQYRFMNTELRKVIEESKMLSYLPQRKGGFMTRCCCLSDQLEDIAKVQSKLQTIVTQLGEVFGLQGVMVYSGYYLSSVVGTYLTYSLFKSGHESLNLTLNTVILAYTWNFFYYLDALLNLSIMLFVLDDHKEMRRLLEERTLFASRLDVRLEESFQSLQFQLVRHPFGMNVMQLFPVTRSSTFAMFGSIITHSIFLIQFDMEYF